MSAQVGFLNQSQEKSEIAHRSLYFDGVRGALILLVIAIHTSNSGAEFYRDKFQNWNFIYTLVIKQILLCAVPAFVMLSGYFSPSATGATAGSLGKRVLRILLPYVVCCLVIVIYRMTSPIEALGSMLMGTALGPHYFVPVILFMVVFEPFLFRPFADSKYFLHCCVGLTLAHILAAYVVHIVQPGLNWWWFMFSPTAWVGYFGLGIYLRRTPPSLSYWPAIAFLALLASVVEAFWFIRVDGLTSGVLEPVKITTFVYSVSICFMIVALAPRAYENGLLVWLGSVSYGIFLFHDLFRQKIDALVRKSHLLFDVQPIFQIIVFLMTALLVFAVAKFSQSLLGRKQAKRWLGF
jgi:fucose 4-O-acetylase-like acetyltransferase